MKIGWATPLNHRSAIGRFSVGVAQVLVRRGIEIELLRTEHASILAEPRLESRLRVRALAQMANYRKLHSYDLLVYNFGDHGKFHLHAVDVAMQMPGICIFHDPSIFDLFGEWMASRGESDRMAAVVDEIYGPGTDRTARDPNHPTVAGENFAMLEWLAPYALGAVAHGRHDLARLATHCAGPIRHIPLACDLPETIRPLRARQPGDALRLTSIGQINANELCAEIISAIGGSQRLREFCSYRLAGPITDEMRQELAALAKRLGVSFQMTGSLSRSELVREIEEADAMLCLRQPSIEGASASAIEAMLSGRPTIVLDHGFYRDLPDNLTLKLRPDLDQHELQQRLSWILDHPAECRKRGERAASWAQKVFSYDSYADAFLGLADKAFEASPLFRLGAQLGQELSALGAAPDDPASIRVAQTAMDLFCPEGRLCRLI